MKKMFDAIKKKLDSLIKKLYKNKFLNIYLLTFFLFTLFVFEPFINSYILGDDSIFHLSNIEARGSDISYILSKTLPYVGNNLGYGTGIFYPCLPHTLGGLILLVINTIGFQNFAAIKLVKFMILFFSGFFMYLLGKKIYQNERKGLFAALFYITSSYFFVDMFFRDALNESCIFVFIPLIFLGLYYLFKEHSKKLFFLCFVSGYVGMMYSHLVLSVWFTIVLLPVLLLFIKDILRKENFLCLLVAAILILVLTSPFTVSLVEHMLVGGGYSVFDTVREGTIWNLSFHHFFIRSAYLTGVDNVLYVNFHWLVLILCIISLIKLLFKKIPKERKKFVIAFLVFGTLGMFLTCCEQFWIFVPEFLKNIQFAWRTCTFATFGICLFAVEGLDYLFSIFKKKFIPLASLILIIVLGFSFHEDLQRVKLYETYNYDIKTGGMGWQKEYLPSETKANMKYFEKRDPQKVIVTKGNAEIILIENKIPNLTFEIKNIEEDIVIELPRLYYLGYKIVDENGIKIKYFKNENGFISFNCSTEGKYYVTYPGTTASKIAIGITITTIIVISIYVIILLVRKRK